MDTAVTWLAEHSGPDRKALVRGLTSETPPCTLTAPGAGKYRSAYNVFHAPIQD